MKLDIKIITGPHSFRVSKEVAEKQLREHPQFPKNASVAIEEVDGRWVAAIATTKKAKKAKKLAAPMDDEMDKKNENPFAESEDSEPEEGETPEHEESESPAEEEAEHSDKPKKEKKDKGGDMKEILELLNTLLSALGIAPEGPAEGLGLEDETPMPPPPSDMMGEAPSKIHNKKPNGGDDVSETHTIHERALKPGEAPVGTTPIGSPSFSSVKVAADHPWADVIGVKRSFPVEEVIGEKESLANVKAELDALAAGTGYEVKQLVEGRTANGKRTAKALISR